MDEHFNQSLFPLKDNLIDLQFQQSWHVTGTNKDNQKLLSVMSFFSKKCRFPGGQFKDIDVKLGKRNNKWCRILHGKFFLGNFIEGNRKT